MTSTFFNLNKILSEIELGPFTEVIIHFTLFFFALLFLITLITYFRILKRRILKRNKKEAALEAQEFIETNNWPHKLSKIHLESLKSLLLERIDWNDDKSDFYYGIYRRYGFVDHDIAGLDARIWWNKIDALLSFDVYFSLLESELQQKVLKTLKKLSRHKKTIIRASANLVLSKNIQEDELQAFFKGLETDAKRGEQLYRDILDNLFERFPLEVIDYIKKHPETNLSRVAIKVVGRSGKTSISHHLGDILKNHSFKSFVNLRALIKAIGDLRAVDYMNVIEQYIPHEDDEVEIAALFSLYRLDPKRFDIGYIDFLIKNNKSSNERLGEIISYISSQAENLEGSPL